MTDTQEIAIIHEVLAGDQEQYRYFVDRYHNGLIQHLYSLMHDQGAAEDTAQEAFIMAYNKLSQYNSQYAFSTWLYKIADNLALRRMKQTKVSLDLDSVQEVLPSEKPTPAQETEINFTKEAVRQAVSGLPTAYQEVISLYYWNNFDYEEIALVMDRPISTIRTWLFRAKEQLRKELYGQV